MKTARNALKGYLYQHYIFTLLLAKMDTERKIVKIISESTDTKNFDDAYVELASGIQYRLQVKNYADVKLEDIHVDSKTHVVRIKNNKNEYDPTDNNIFVLNADFKVSCDQDFLGIPAIQAGDITIVPLSEENVADIIDGLYQSVSRELQIIQFGYKFISSDKFEVATRNLPLIITISMDLNQKTVLIRDVPKNFHTGITHIEGKPGVGKSHYVNEIIKSYPGSIIYRFWIESQDPELNKRLRFEVFIEQIGLQAFQSPESFTVDELIEQLCRINKLVIIDGLDHVENYNHNDLNRFMEFFDKLSKKPVKVIILSRPMKASLTWKKVDMTDWTRDETSLYLAAAYSITDYKIQREIYAVSNGYPIITYFLAKHYLKYQELIIDKPIDSIYEYYDKLISDVKTKSLLGVFASNNSFFTFEEIEGLCGLPWYKPVREFINGYPYLFEIRANRISLVHDSFNTFLKQQEEPIEWIEKVNQKVCEKLLAGDVEYMARLSSFHLDESVISDIIKKYSDFEAFEKLMRSTVDYNSISEFYEQLQRMLDVRPDVLDIYQYYSFALIFQIVTRNNLIGYEDLIFQILQYIQRDGGVENQIFSSGIMWQVYLECEDQLRGAIKRYMKNTMYGDTQARLAYKSINEEIQFFDCLDNKLDAFELLHQIDSDENNSLKKSQLLQKYLVSAWIQQDSKLPLLNEFRIFVEKDNEDPIYEKLHSEYHFDKYDAKDVYYVARYRLHELGFFKEKNICRQGSILSIVKEKAPEGSFDVASSVLSFLRLANHENREVDICNINYVWSMYAQRKDYSVDTIDVALCTYERAGLIDESDSIEIICRLMRQSEKGIRHLLASYIDLKGPEYVKRLAESGKIFEMESQVDFFEIDPENINCLPENIIRKRLINLIDHYSWDEYIDGGEVRNVLRSDYAKLICNVLSSLDKKVKGGLDDEEIAVLNEHGIEYVRENDAEVKEYLPFRDGCIGREDFGYIKENHMSIIECSRYADGWYTCLPYVDLYELFDIQKVREQYLAIIHNALFAKVIRGEHIGSWSNIIGNIPAFLEKYGVDVDWKRLFNIMLRFMDLSVIYYPDKLKGA